PLVLADRRWFDLAAFDVSRVTWQGWTGLAFITLVTAYLNYLLWYIVTARFDVTRSAVVTNAHFLVTVFVEAAFFGQRLNAWVFAGSAVLLSGIVLATGEATPLPEKE
ncbi:MAG: EamA family transporter, partial [Phycisphaerales bacterium]|nr:EamA family transporter [Phycisphaerales bacterium]